MKKIIGTILALTMLVTVFPGYIMLANAASPIENIYVNGKPLKFSEAEKPFIKDDRTMVPLRAITEALGATVYWFNSDKRIQIVRYDTTLRMFIGLPGLDIYKIDGSDQKKIDTVQLEVAAFQGDESRDFRTFVPIRAVIEAFGANINASFVDNDETKVDRAMNIYILDDYDAAKENIVSIAELYDTQDIQDLTLISTEGYISKIDTTYYLQDEDQPYKMITFTNVPEEDDYWKQQIGAENNNPVGIKVRVTGMVTLVDGNYSMPLKRGTTGLKNISVLENENKEGSAVYTPSPTQIDNLFAD